MSYSEGYARVLGLSIEAVADYQDQPYYRLVHPEDRERVKREFDSAVKKGLKYELEYRIIRTDGSTRDVHEIGIALPGVDGQCQELKGTIQDITERKNVAREIRSAKTEAEMANKAKSDFLSSMSHELRTPLNAIIGFAQVMEINAKEPLTKLQESAVNQIVKGGQYLHELIIQVLEFARIETGEIKLSIQPLDLDQSYILRVCR